MPAPTLPTPAEAVLITTQSDAAFAFVRSRLAAPWGVGERTRTIVLPDWLEDRAGFVRNSLVQAGWTAQVVTLENAVAVRVTRPVQA